MKIAFIGGGNMATALIAGMKGKTIHVVDPSAEALQRLAARYGVSTAPCIDAYWMQRRRGGSRKINPCGKRGGPPLRSWPRNDGRRMGKSA